MLDVWHHPSGAICLYVSHIIILLTVISSSEITVSMSIDTVDTYVVHSHNSFSMKTLLN